MCYNTGIMKKTDRFGYKVKTGRLRLPLVLVFFCLSAITAYAQRSPIDVNLIVDGSAAYTGVKDEVSSWVSVSLVDQVLVLGDRVTVWNAGSAAKVIYSGIINGEGDKEAIKKAVRELAASGSRADFSGALKEASGKQGGSFTYTVLISASSDALSTLVSGPQSGYLRYSRVQEFSGWRALVLGLNLDAKVRRASTAFFGS